MVARPVRLQGRCQVTDPTLPDEPFDPTADTGRFQAFVHGADDGDEDDRPAAAGVPFRLITLAAGLLVLAVLVVVLFLL